jgi:hypothetical protein
MNPMNPSRNSGNQSADSWNVDEILEKAKDVTVVPAQFFGAVQLMILEKETSVERNSTATQHFTESNAIVSDHIIVKPRIFKIEGIISKNRISFKKELLSPVQDIAKKARAVLDVGSQVVAGYEAVKKRIQENNGNPLDIANDSLATAGDLYALYQNVKILQTEVGSVVNFLDAISSTKQLVSIKTPYGFFTNLVMSYKVNKRTELDDMADVTLTFTEFPFRPKISTIASNKTEKDLDEYKASESPTTEKKGKKIDKSAVKKVFKFIKDKLPF